MKKLKQIFDVHQSLNLLQHRELISEDNQILNWIKFIIEIKFEMKNQI